MATRKQIVVAGALSLSTILSGCSLPYNNTSEQPPVQQQPVIEYLSVGDSFLRANLKIKATVTDVTVTPSRSLKFELYVDKNGNGQGMMGLGDRVYDVIISGDNLYVKVADGNYIRISDVTGRLVRSDAKLSGATDMVSLGFSLSGTTPVGYTSRTNSIVVDTKFAQSSNTFATTAVAESQTMTIPQLAKYIADYNTDISVGVDQKEETPGNDIEISDKTFYVNSPYGVMIDGKVYSIGDTCNPSYYFGEDDVPHGVLYSNIYKQDTRVDFVHYSYLATNGMAMITTLKNYVQRIWSDADWKFLEIEKGMDSKEIGKLLGLKLTKEEQETWTPMAEGLTVIKSAADIYQCELGILKIEIRMVSGKASEIYVEQTLNVRQ